MVKEAYPPCIALRHAPTTPWRTWRLGGFLSSSHLRPRCAFVLFARVGLQAGLFPGAETPGQRTNIRVAHALQRVRREDAPAAAAAVHHDRLPVVGQLLADLRFERTPGDRDGAGDVLLAPVVLLTHVDDRDLLARVQFRVQRRRLHLDDPVPRLGHHLLICLGHRAFSLCPPRRRSRLGRY